MFQNGGEVTCWDPMDMDILTSALNQPVHGPPLDKAAVFPSPAQVHFIITVVFLRNLFSA
jgi:hypothetical protein